MNTGLTFSIILPVLNDQENLDRILDQFSKNSWDGNWELIVVDDGSSQPLSLGVDPQSHWRILRNSENRGVAISRNRGIDKAKGEYIIFLSVFLSIPDDYIQQITGFTKKVKFDFAQHLIVLEQNIKATQFQRFLGAHAERIDPSSTNLAITNCQFAAAVVKAETVRAVGGFDESMQHYGGHELDLIYRLDQAGYKRRVLINDIVLQRVKLEEHKRIQNRLREYGQVGLPNLLNKHPELTPMILKKPILWTLFSRVGFSRWLENRLGGLIDSNQPLSLFTYRLYLHILMRNAWDAR
ncbi:MAG: glycosyltransferase family 2 protein [Candidatus Marinimicrobia bacterium]|nr:glycosyltransferase family 2 protein [Candidatus Neomarinimicrobiota bacterium]